jgi:hypothetical protein
MYTREQHYSQNMTFSRRILVKSGKEIDPGISDTLYLVDLYTSIHEPYIQEKLKMTKSSAIDEIYEKMVYYPHFGDLIRCMLTPVCHARIEEGHDQQTAITIAVHVRKGSGGDRPLLSKQVYTINTSDYQMIPSKQHPRKFQDVIHPLKFVPEQYYIDQINKVTSSLPDRKFIVYLVTDASEPERILNTFQKHCSSNNCEIILKTGQGQNSVILDILTMATCDCLIRSCSHFAGIAQLIGNHKMIISPKKYCWADEFLVVTETNILINDSMFEKLSPSQT